MLVLMGLYYVRPDPMVYGLINQFAGALLLSLTNAKKQT